VKRFFRKAFQLAPILIGMAWINWSIDPVMLYDHHFEDPSRHPYVSVITRDMIAGKPHPMVTGYSERLVDEVMFRTQPKIDILVLGSSMAKPIHSEMFPGQSLFNAAVCGGRIEEAVSLWEIARGCGIHPKRVLLEMDTRFFGQRPVPLSAEWSDIFRQARQRLCGDANSPEPETSLMWLLDRRVPAEQAAGFAGGKGLLHPYDTLISPRYLQFSLLVATRKWISGKSYPVIFGEEDQNLLYPDGSVDWCSHWRLRKITDFHLPTKDPQTPIVAAEWMRPTDSQRRMIEALTADMQKSEAEVEVVLLPPNPWLYDQAVTEYRRDGKTLPSAGIETYLRQFAAAHGIRVIGSLDPHKAGVVEEEFVDFLHLRREAMGRLFAKQKDGNQPSIEK
jgi:hypothetical protein